MKTTSPISTACLTFIMLAAAAVAHGASYEWTFNNGTLSADLGNGEMTYRDAATQGLTTFGTTDGSTVPHIGGQPAQYIGFPQFSPVNGYFLRFNDTGPNGGGSYVNQYSLVLDLYSPGAADWQALFNTDPENNNDADFYIAPDGRLGIGDLGYAPAGTIAQDTWYRIGFTADLASGDVSYYVDGSPVYNRTGGSLVDGRYSLYSNQDALASFLMFNEGDGSGNYTHPLFVNSIYFTDQTLTPAEMLALGGPNAAGIVVPEPGSFALLGLGMILVLGRRWRCGQPTASHDQTP
jgi:hypothetical protein